MSFPWAKHYAPKHPVMKWVDEKLPLPRLVYGAIGAGYPVPRNLNYFWNFGVLAGAALAIQIVTGIVLAMHYAANASVAFDSVEHIMRDVNSGWLLRYAHANGASFFFIVVYTHIFRGLYYGSYKAPREMVWLLGVVIFLLMMATAFMGYVLPWGQMSFWGAQVITGFFSAIPVVGDTIRIWLLGGYAPDDAALNRFFSLHYLLPFVIAGVIVLHIWALHIPGSNNPTGIDVQGPADTVPFHPYYTAKDGFGLGVFLLCYTTLMFFAPNLLGHPDNYIPGQPALDARAHRARMVFPALLRDPQVVHLQLPVHPRQAVGRDGDVRIDPAPVLPAVDRSLAGALGELPAGLSLVLRGAGDRRRDPRLSRPGARHADGRAAQPDLRGLLLLALSHHPAAGLAFRDAAAAAQLDLRVRAARREGGKRTLRPRGRMILGG